jgi:hypothetical protein
MSRVSPFTDMGLAKTMGLVHPGKLTRELYTTRKGDASLIEGLFEHPNVSSGLANACRDRLIRRSAWKGYSQKSTYSILHSFGPMIRQMALCPGRVPNPKPHIYWCGIRIQWREYGGVEAEIFAPPQSLEDG